MGNPAEKTIRNPNLKRLLFEVRKRVNKKFYFTAEIFSGWREKCKVVQHRPHSVHLQGSETVL